MLGSFDPSRLMGLMYSAVLPLPSPRAPPCRTPQYRQGALAVRRDCDGADYITGCNGGADRERFVHGFEGAAPPIRMRNNQYFAVDDRAAENHFSRCRCVDAPVVFGYGKVYAAVPCAPALGGLLKGTDHPRSGFGGGGAVA